MAYLTGRFVLDELKNWIIDNFPDDWEWDSWIAKWEAFKEAGRRKAEARIAREPKHKIMDVTQLAYEREVVRICQ